MYLIPSYNCYFYLGLKLECNHFCLEKSYPEGVY